MTLLLCIAVFCPSCLTWLRFASLLIESDLALVTLLSSLPLLNFYLGIAIANRLYHKGRVEQANELAIKINSLIVAERSKSLSNLENATPKQLWAAVDRIGKYNSGNTRILTAKLSPYYFT